MSKQTLLNLFPFVWIITVGLCYFILVAFTLFFFLPLLLITCWHQLQMEIMFHQFGKYRILINKNFFPWNLFWRVLSFVFLWFIQEKKKESGCSVPIGSWWEQKPAVCAHRTPPHPHLHLPRINPSPQGSGLHRWVCSDTLVRLKSQAGFINSYSGNVDTPFCIVTNACINLLWPSVLQNYISSYMIKSDGLQSVSPLNLS